MNNLFRELKAQFYDCIVLFQMGDFVCAYGEDADTMSRVCDLYCYGSGTADSSITFSMLTVHQYMRQMVDAGFKVIIANRNTPELNLN
jgi:DNA mismatch repair ATPase MutS